jgi:hypothetical protein
MEPAVRSPWIESAIITDRVRNVAFGLPTPKFPAASGVNHHVARYSGVIRRSLLNSSSCATSHHARARRFSSTLARTLLAGCRIDFSTRLDWLLHFRKSSAVAGGALDLCNVVFGFESFHEIHAGMRKRLSLVSTPVAQIGFIGTRSTFAISLCETELASPSSQEMVTSLQDVPITVPRSVVAAPQQTRSPTLSPLDWSPVMGVLFRPLLLSASIGVIAISSPSLSDEPSSFVNIELYQTFASHFQQKGLAGFLHSRHWRVS